MATYKTPDVYVEEISLFPPSVAEVETAIPAFIGYTERAEKNGVKVDVPTKITSLVEYKEIFGGAPPVKVKEVGLDANNTVSKTEIESTFYMYDALRMFFNNGGGKCYIISIGSYDEQVSKEHFKNGLDKLKKKDEPTIILFPDAVLLEDGLYTVQQWALTQCGELQDRFAVFDLLESKTSNNFDWAKGYEEFRTKIGINNLKYGAAYTPYLKTSLSKNVRYVDIKDKLIKNKNQTELKNLTTEPKIITTIETLEKSIDDRNIILGDESTEGSIKYFLKNSAENAASLKVHYYELLLKFKAELNKQLAIFDDENISNDTADATTLRRNFRDLFDYIYNVADKLLDEWAKPETGLTEPTKETEVFIVTTIRDLISGPLKDVLLTLNQYNKDAQNKIGGTTFNGRYNNYAWDASEWGDTFTDTSITADNSIYPFDGTDTEQKIKNMRDGVSSITAIFEQVDGAIAGISVATSNFVDNYETTLRTEFPLFKNIINEVGSFLTILPPSGVIAGVYAMVDSTRGVWKAPANVSLNGVVGLTETIDNKEQEDLNVDVVAGKSINAIRAFTGKGILVWGARTLAGNDNEWRYISVRRFFNMVEESVKKSTYWAVFEPNDANTWIKVKSMIENYLTQKWRDGALAGAKPDQAFFVKVGLGTTMTAQDILEGRMNVEIGMAVVRPAEFIILKFSHKMQES